MNDEPIYCDVCGEECDPGTLYKGMCEGCAEDDACGPRDEPFGGPFDEDTADEAE